MICFYTNYYGKNGNARHPGLTLSSRLLLITSLLYPSSESLESLVNACDPATFGKNKEDIYDELYRKAKKLSPGSFAVGLDVAGLGLMKIICESLMHIRQNSGKGSASRIVQPDCLRSLPYSSEDRSIADKCAFRRRIILQGTSWTDVWLSCHPISTSFEGGNLIMKKGEK